MTILPINAAASDIPKDGVPNAEHGRRLAYLLSSYPAISHTFFLNEIVELRKLGFVIDVASINQPNLTAGPISQIEAQESAGTFYVKVINAARVLLLCKLVFTRPQVVFRGLLAALRLGGWNLPASGYALFYLAEALLLGNWMHRSGHTHLHIHFGGPVATVGMLTSIAWQFSYSMMIHGPEEFYDVDESYLRRKVEGARFVLCISDYCQSQVMKVCDPAHWSKLHVVRLGVDPEVFAPTARTTRSSELEIACVGRFVPAKGHLILLRAFSNLVLRGHRLRLRLIGDGSERSSLEAFVTNNQLSRLVVIEGALSHEATRRCLREADIFVLASFAEGLPIALMEAMAMEIPCVSTFVAGIPELIRHDLEGLLVPASSEQALTDALERLISNPELRAALAEAGRRRVLEFYNLRKNVNLLSAVLRDQLPQGLGETPARRGY